MSIDLTPDLPPTTPTPPSPDLPSVIAGNAIGPKQVTVDGQTTMQHSLPDQIAADRYAKSNAASKRAFPFKRVQFIRPGAAGADCGANNGFYDDPNWR